MKWMPVLLSTITPLASASAQDGNRDYLEHRNDLGVIAYCSSKGTIVSQLAKQKDYDMSCRLAASSMMREIKSYNKYLNATDPDMQKIASAGIKLAASSVERSLSECE